MKFRTKRGALALATFGAAISFGTQAQAITYVTEIVASGLNNPRGVTIGDDGALYIAEGGYYQQGGPVVTSPEGGAVTYAETGSISRVSGGVKTTIVSNLPTLANPGPADTSAAGPQDVAFHNGTGYFLIGMGGDPAIRANPGPLGSAPGAANLASLYSFTLGGSIAKIADLGAYEGLNNDDGDLADTNPYHLTSGPNGLLVTDAGGNTLLNVTEGGDITTVSIFDEVAGVDSVPTGIAIGPDGAFYVGELTGAPFGPAADGRANVFRIDQLTGDKTLFASGFTNITDIDFDADGNLYVLQFAENGLGTGTPGIIERVDVNGARSTVINTLVAPTGLDVAANGDIYVTNFSPVAGIGEVLRISAVPEPATWAMMIGGFALAGASLRRRKTSIRFA